VQDRRLPDWPKVHPCQARRTYVRFPGAPTGSKRTMRRRHAGLSACQVRHACHSRSTSEASDPSDVGNRLLMFTTN
jgi:hypothetical protein